MQRVRLPTVWIHGLKWHAIVAALADEALTPHCPDHFSAWLQR